ncbi:MAG: FliG C-terminal domain-containing protein, partial [Devosia sp.]|nr:FliG C-terminal domain-containing protein [Devosia sp.]
AERIKALMFTFEDLARLDSSVIQTLLQKMDKKELGLALKGANEQVKELFFGNISTRAGKILKDDMEAMGPVRLKDVDEAQGRMVAVAKDMAARGEIVISKTKSDEEMIS